MLSKDGTGPNVGVSNVGGIPKEFKFFFSSVECIVGFLCFFKLEIMDNFKICDGGGGRNSSSRVATRRDGCFR